MNWNWYTTAFVYLLLSKYLKLNITSIMKFYAILSLTTIALKQICTYLVDPLIISSYENMPIFRVSEKTQIRSRVFWKLKTSRVNKIFRSKNLSFTLNVLLHLSRQSWWMKFLVHGWQNFHTRDGNFLWFIREFSFIQTNF